MNYRAVSRLLGRLIMLLAAAQLLPVLWCLWYGETGAIIAFLSSAAIALALGFALSRVPAPESRLYRREGILIVVTGWVLASALGALPFVLTGDIPNPVDALFESSSGFTTTGASVLTNIEAAGRGVLFWRSMTQWLGGLGIIVLFVALLSELGPGARFLYSVEVPGPTTEVLHPRVHETAVVLLRIYLGLTAAQILFLMLAGLDLYDAITHTFSTLSTGGFSPNNDSAASYSPLVQWILVIFMIIAGVNFSLLYAMRRGASVLWRDREFQVYLGMILATTLWITFELVTIDGGSLGRSFLDSIFHVSSIATTTGFASADFDRWPFGSRAILVILMLIGGSAGSTAGGVKVMRVLISLKTALREVRITFSPNAVIPVTISGKPVPGSVTRSVSGFLILYVAALVISSVVLTLHGHDLITASTAAIACLGNIGPGLAEVGPTANFAGFGAWEKLLLTALMWLGRLEIMAIAAVLTRSFWRG